LDEEWLNIVRLARDVGDISSLFPPGVTRVYDLPYTIFNAIRLALHFLRFEELEEKERPPKKIWLDADRMKEWWAEVKRNRESEAKGEGDYMSLPQNDLIKQMLGRSAP
jgi:hypothetical protein